MKRYLLAVPVVVALLLPACEKSLSGPEQADCELIITRADRDDSEDHMRCFAASTRVTPVADPEPAVRHGNPEPRLPDRR